MLKVSYIHRNVNHWLRGQSAMAKNQAESVKQRLLTLARVRKEDYNFILRQFVLQRLMYRLSISAYSDDFLLKGGLLYWVWNENFHRPTMDMDLLGLGSDDSDLLEKKFQTIIQLESDDGLVFDAKKLVVTDIKEEAKYQGVRITGSATLVKAVIPYQVDIAFGDAVETVKHKTSIPIFLTDLLSPEMKVYPVESVIAEKFHAMVALGLVNSRMKDFFDLVTFAEMMPLKSAPLQSAIQATFKRRDAVINSDVLTIFTDAFKTDTHKQEQWQVFFRKNNLDVGDSFTATMDKIQILLEPLYLNIASSQGENKIWNAETWRWE